MGSAPHRNKLDHYPGGVNIREMRTTIPIGKLDSEEPDGGAEGLPRNKWRRKAKTVPKAG